MPTQPLQGLASSAADLPQHDHYEASPLSDFGSLNTVAHSSDEANFRAITPSADELDSLDDGLQEFQAPSTFPPTRRSRNEVGAILPAHDGLGMFSPLRTPCELHARSSVSCVSGFDTVGERQPRHFAQSHGSELEEAPADVGWLDKSRAERIEQWRTDQSRFLRRAAEETQIDAKAKQWSGSDQTYLEKAGIESSRPKPRSRLSHRAASDRTSWQDLAHRLVQDWLGIHETTLRILFGEELPDMAVHGCSSPRCVGQHCLAQPSCSVSSYPGLVEEIWSLTRPLLSGNNPQLRSDSPRLEYAGMPIEWLSKRHQARPRLDRKNPGSVNFFPTVDHGHSCTLPQSSKETRVFDSVEGREKGKIEDNRHFSFQGLQAMFRVLCQNLLALRSTTSEDKAAKLATLQNREALRRAAMIQQHHPLASNIQSRGRKPGPTSFISQSLSISNLLTSTAGLKRHHSSRASWSTKRSRLLTPSERLSKNYWDIESFGTGSAVLAGVGSWGEL